MEHLTIETFKNKIMDFENSKDEWKFEGELPAIIKFSASWCFPCKTLAPIIEEIQEEFKDEINIYEIDTEDQQELSAMFGIKSIPSILFIPKDGEPQMSVGVIPKNKIVDAINEILLK